LVRGEALAPETVAEQHHAAAAGLLLFRKEGAAERGSDSEDGEESGSHLQAFNALRLVGAGQVEVLKVPGGDGFEDLVAAFPIEVIGDGDELLGKSARGILLPQGDDSAGAGIGKRVEENDVEEAEDRGVGGDAHAEGEHRRESE